MVYNLLSGVWLKDLKIPEISTIPIGSIILFTSWGIVAQFNRWCQVSILQWKSEMYRSDAEQKYQ